jgi:hypothetical protein
MVIEALMIHFQSSLEVEAGGGRARDGFQGYIAEMRIMFSVIESGPRVQFCMPSRANSKLWPIGVSDGAWSGFQIICRDGLADDLGWPFDVLCASF